MVSELDFGLIDMGTILDLPQVDLFLISPSSGEVAKASASDVSRERATCFTCRNVSQTANFWREKT